jgi:hypothetical protein
MMRKIFAALLACGMIFSAGAPFPASAAISDPDVAQLRAMIAQLQQQIMMLQQQLYAQESGTQQTPADGAQTQSSHIGLAYIISYPETINVTPGQAGVTAVSLDVKSIKESAFLSGLTLSYKPSQQGASSDNYPVRAALYSGSAKIAEGTFSQDAYSFDFEQVISPTVARRLAVKVDVPSAIAMGGNFSIISYSITDASDVTSSKPANISGNTLAYASRVSPSPSPAESRNIAINAPEQGEVVIKGTQYMIQWSSRTASSNDFAIYLKQEGGAMTRIGSAPATARSFSWSVPSSIANGRYKISIQPATNAAQGGESGVFTIASSSDAGKPGTPSNLLLSLSVNPERISVRPGQTDVAAMSFSARSIKGTTILTRLTLSYKPSQQGASSDNYPVRAAIYSGSTKIAEGTGSQGYYLFYLDQTLQQQAAKPFTVKVDMPYALTSGGTFFLIGYTVMDVLDASYASTMNIAGNTLVYSEPGNTSRKITIDSPSTGEIVAKGTTVSVDWITPNNTSNGFNIFMTKEGGSKMFLESVAGSERTYAWSVPGNIVEGKYMASVEFKAPPTIGGIGGWFTIAGGQTPPPQPFSASISGRTEIGAGEAGTWTIQASGAGSSSFLSRITDWGDGTGGSYPPAMTSTRSYSHAYAKAGTYAITASVAGGGSTLTKTLSVKVGGGTTDGGNISVSFITPASGERVAAGQPYAVSYSIQGSPIPRLHLYYVNMSENPYYKYMYVGLVTDAHVGINSYTWNVPQSIAPGSYRLFIAQEHETGGAYIIARSAVFSVTTTQEQPFAATLSGSDNPRVGETGTYTIQASGAGSSSFLSRITDWGDGTGGSYPPAMTSTRSYSHAYAKAGTYIVKAAVTGNGMTLTKTLVVTVWDGTATNPFSASISGRTEIGAGEAGTWTIQASGAGSSSFLSRITDWGDGTGGSYPPAMTSTRSYSHAYAKAGTYAITASVAGGGSTLTKTLSVKVGGGTTPPPATPLPTTPSPSSLTVQPVDGPSSVLVNQSNSWAISATGGTSSTWYMVVDWGDGARSSVMTCSNPCYAHHTYASAGTHSVQFKVSSESNGRVYTTKPWTVQAQYDAAIAVPDKPVITSAVLSGPTAVTLSWNPAARACGYNVYRSVDVPDDESLIAKVTSGTTSYTDSGLAANTDYYYYVKAYCAYGESPMSRVPYEMHTLAPIGVSLSPDAGTIQVSWNNPNSEYPVANLVIERNGTQIYNAASSGRSKTITSYIDGVTANGSVSYAVTYAYSVPDGVTRATKSVTLSAQKSVYYDMAAASSVKDVANVLESASQAIARFMDILNAR